MLAAVLTTLLGAGVLAATGLARRRRLEAERLLAERARREVAPDERTAAHEAGHAILAWVSPKVSRVTVVTLDDEDGNGVVRFERGPVRTDGDRWDGIVIGLAGIAGEGTAFSSVRSGGAQRDLQRSLAWAQELADAGRAAETLSPGEPRARSTIDVGAMYDVRPSPAVCAILNKAYRQAKDVIAARPDKFDALRARLRERRTLGPSEVEEILGPRPWALR